MKWLNCEIVTWTFITQAALEHIYCVGHDNIIFHYMIYMVAILK